MVKYSGFSFFKFSNNSSVCLTFGLSHESFFTARIFTIFIGLSSDILYAKYSILQPISRSFSTFLAASKSK